LYLNFSFNAAPKNFLVVRSAPQVVAHFDNLELAKSRLKNISGKQSRLIAEVDENGKPVAEMDIHGKFKKSPKSVGGQEQIDKNDEFNNKWYLMGDVINMIRSCETHLLRLEKGKARKY